MVFCLDPSGHSLKNLEWSIYGKLLIFKELIVQFVATLVCKSLGGLKKRKFSPVLEARIPRLRCWQGWFLLRLISLACRWLPSRCVLTWSFLCVSVVYKFPPFNRIPVMLC